MLQYIHLFFHYLHDVLPVLIVDSSFIHVVRNFGSRIAAAINSGSPDVAKTVLDSHLQGKFICIAHFSNKH